LWSTNVFKALRRFADDSEKNVRQIRRAARIMGSGFHKDQTMSAELPSLKELFLAAAAVAPAERGAWL